MFVIGFVFSLGLGVSGMTNQVRAAVLEAAGRLGRGGGSYPLRVLVQKKIISFLCFTNGSWDPSLILVMGSAMIPSFIANVIAKKKMSVDS